MNYIIVEHRQTVLLGPMPWRQRFFQSEFDDLEVEYQVMPVESGYVKVNDVYEIFPVISHIGPEINTTYEQQVGPFYLYENDQAISTFTSQQLPIEQIRQNLKQQLSAERYKRESAGTSVVLNDITYFLPTDRMNSTQFDYSLYTVGAGTVNWKFSNVFVVLDQPALQLIVGAIKSHIQTQFDWEKTMIDLIDATDSVDAFKAIEIVKPVELLTGPGQ